LRSAPFTPEESPGPTSTPAATEEKVSDDLRFWPEFYVTLPPHSEAVALVIRKGEEEVARLEPSGVAVSLHLDNDDPLQIGAEPFALSWRAESGEAVVFDVEYSPTGEAPWQLLSLHQKEAEIEIDPGSLPAGPRPQLRITGQSGLHAASETTAVRLL